jgi:hypothetical protein
MAVADLVHHLEIEHRPLMQALRFEEFAFALQLRPIPRQFFFDRFDGAAGPIARRHEVGLGIDSNLVVAADGLSGQRVE